MLGANITVFIPGKCRGITQYGKQCSFGPVNGTRFCDKHQHMNHYSEEMLHSLRSCSGCHKPYFFGPGGEVGGANAKVCDKCRLRSTVDAKNKRKAQPKCEVVLTQGKKIGEKCNCKKQPGSKYCGTHKKLHDFIDATVAAGKKVCFNNIRGCREQLSADYGYSKCPTCLQAERDVDHARRGAAQAVRAAAPANAEVLTCTVCTLENPVAMFIGVREQTTNTCSVCRNQARVQDERRSDDHERIFDRYRIDARRVQVAFDVDFATYMEVVVRDCYFCGDIDACGFNHLGRILPSNGYVTSNVLSCCDVCTRLRQSIDDIETYLLRVEHILLYNGRITSGLLSPDVFPDRQGSSFAIFQRGAQQRNLPFLLNEQQFQTLTDSPCYLCGKQNSDSHRNGLDRIDNDVGYLQENVHACCCNCNKMKWTYGLSEVLEKMEKTHARHCNTSAAGTTDAATASV